ncbi:MAG: DNA topoisomerase IV subunit A [Bacilli bacterium]
MKKKIEEKSIVEKIYDFSLEEIMGERFGAYSKYIIQDRALPDVRDGLKPVQRRILFSMYKDKNTFDKPTKKSATTVGNVIGKYHPHGDTSVYEAMVRMSQKWKQREILVDMQGNNGSIDGDGPAAYRYTEARLSKISGILLKDIEKESVLFAPTFDDERVEPTVMPAHFPNLLVNGANGISAGYATNMPTHNLGEVIDATIKRIDSPNCSLDTIMNIMPGPDFPTGGILEGREGLVNAYTTGRGKVVLKARCEFISEKGNDQIIIHEIPYDVLKSTIIRKTEEIRLDKKIDGIIEVRDESDKNDNLRIALDIKKGADKELILNYLLKNTDLQVNYNFNCVAIAGRRPKELGLLEILDAFISHKKDVVTRRSQFDLDHAKLRMHLVEGFIKVLDILDEVIKTIRQSKDKADAKVNLIEKYQFSEMQSEAIVVMQLYKLTNTDVTELQKEYGELKILIEELNSILTNEDVLKNLMKTELREIKREFSTPRLTQIRDNVTEIKIDTTAMVNKDDYIICITHSGYIKKVSLKSFSSLNVEDVGVKEGDYIEGIYKVNNLDTIILFTNLGNYLFLPVHTLNEFKYKDLGSHISSIVSVSDGEIIVKSIAVNKFDETNITLFTKYGMVKRMALSSLLVTRYTKPINCFKLKENDQLLSVSVTEEDETLIITKKGLALLFNTSEIPVLGSKTSGVKAIKLVEDEVVSAFVINSNEEYLTLFTTEDTAKRLKISDLVKTTRAKKGSLIIKSPKIKNYYILKAFNNSSKAIFGLINSDITFIKASDINIMDKFSVGSTLISKNLNDVFKKYKFKDMTEDIKEDEVKDETENEIVDVKEETKEPQNYTMSDFFEDFKI